MAATYSVEAACVTHRGSVRATNEDALFCGQIIHGETMENAEPTVGQIGPPWTVTVADGIGGNLAGERASQETVEHLARLKEYDEKSLRHALDDINEHLQNLGDKDVDLHGMGTTVAGLACGRDGLLAYHVGDSRIYRIQDGFLAQITQDHSVEEMLREEKNFPVEELPASIRRALTQCLGGKFNESGLNPHMLKLQVQKPTRFLLCTDGLSEALDHDTMEKIAAKSTSLMDIVEELTQAALDRTAKDNVTVIAAEVAPIKRRGKVRSTQAA